MSAADDVPTTLRTAVHVHFHYPDLIGDFLAKLSANRTRCDLLLTTDTAEKAAILASAGEGFASGSLKIRIVPNRGRDIGPFLTGCLQELVREYDVIGHLHAKRSLSIDAPSGDRWREFLWQHLAGDLYPMMDLVLTVFARDERLGIVFAEEPHLVDWGENLALASELANRAGIREPLSPFLEFPVGTMFWARSQALTPFLQLGLDWSHYPDEPLARDGTILHAIERLFPFAAAEKGYSFATTHIPGISW
jgi:lipopolysaccharide biosynthesis protein